MPKWTKKDIQNNKKMDAPQKKTSQGTFKDTLAEQGRKNIAKGIKLVYAALVFGTHFGTHILNIFQKYHPGRHAKNKSRGNMKKGSQSMPKWNQ